MESFHRWEPFRSQSVHTLSCNSVTLASSPQRPEPETSHLIPESIEFPLVAWYGVVLEVSLYNAAQPFAHGRNGMVQAYPEFTFDLSQFRLHALSDGLPKHDESAVP